MVGARNEKEEKQTLRSFSKKYFVQLLFFEKNGIIVLEKID